LAELRVGAPEATNGPPKKGASTAVKGAAGGAGIPWGSSVPGSRPGRDPGSGTGSGSDVGAAAPSRPTSNLRQPSGGAPGVPGRQHAGSPGEDSSASYSDGGGGGSGGHTSYGGANGNRRQYGQGGGGGASSGTGAVASLGSTGGVIQQNHSPNAVLSWLWGNQ
jgi:endoglucanase